MKTAQEIINEKGAEMVSVSPDTTLFDAIKIMIKNRIGSILIRDGGEIVGKWTEGDLLESITTTDFDIHTIHIKDVMNKKFPTAPHTTPVFSLMDRFLETSTRHLMIERGGKYIGILSISDAVRACLKEKDQELEKLSTHASWEYYEQWRGKKIK